MFSRKYIFKSFHFATAVPRENSMHHVLGHFFGRWSFQGEDLDSLQYTFREVSRINTTNDGF